MNIFENESGILGYASVDKLKRWFYRSKNASKYKQGNVSYVAIAASYDKRIAIMRHQW